LSLVGWQFSYQVALKIIAYGFLYPVLLTFVSGYEQIERDTYGMLQCHPYPHEYADPSRQCAHCAFFMGLSRKEGVKIQEGQQFDIRGTVDEFRHEISMYMFWKPGMELAVSHVRRKQIPAYVFPEGHRRYRPPRHVNNQQQPDKNNNDEGTMTESTDGRPKRKHDCADDAGYAKRASISPVHPKTPSPQPTNDGDDACNNQIKRSSSEASGGSQVSRGSGNLERANSSNSPQTHARNSDTAASGLRCTTRGAVFSGEGTNKHDISIVEKCTPPAVAVCIKRVAEKVVSELVVSERLGSNSAELLERTEKDILVDNVHFGGSGVLKEAFLKS
jgi:poly(A) polymerase